MKSDTYPSLEKSKQSLRTLLDNGATYGSLSLQLSELVGKEVSKGAIYKFVTKPEYDPTSDHLRKAFGLPHMKPAPACAHCGEVPLKRKCSCRSNGSSNPKPRPKMVSLGKLTPEEDADIMSVPPAVRRQAILDYIKGRKK